MEPLRHLLFRFEKSSILRFVMWIGRGLARIFWNWTFLKIVLGMIALIIIFYVEEDWRGAHAWAVTKAEWEAKGESFDYNKFIPPPVPDDQNLAALPLFKLESAKDDDGSSYLGVVALNRAMRNDLPQLDFPSTGNWQKGELPDMAKIQKVLAADYALAFKDAKSPDDALAQFDAIYPFLADLRAAAATRPLCRFNVDYAVSPPAMRPLGPITAQIKLSKILTLHAILALDRHQSDLALEDIKLNYRLLTSVQRDPTLLGGLVAIGMAAIGDGAIYDGLVRHAWSDAQLVELDRTLKPINFLADYQFAMRAEFIGFSLPSLDYLKKRKPHLERFFNHDQSSEDFLDSDLMFFLWPNGWLDQNRSLTGNALLGATSFVDSKAHRVFVDQANHGQHEARRFDGHWTAYAPWNIFYAMSAGPILNAINQYAHAQTWIDEARIACALERYHLVHGVYPESLGALVPACIDAVPCDPINGAAYHYRVQPDGTFLLYSVGWNQTDDGGKVVYHKEGQGYAPETIDYTNGDWVWPMPEMKR